MFYLTTHSTHFIYGYMMSDIWLRTILIVRKETRCHHISYSYRLTARVLMHHPTDRITHTTAFVTPVVEHWLEREIAQWVHPMKDRSDDPSHHERTLYLWATSRSQTFRYLGAPSSKVKFVLFNDATGTHWFLSYHRLLDVIHMVTLTHFLDGNPLPPHRLLFSISSKGSFICTFP